MPTRNEIINVMATEGQISKSAAERALQAMLGKLAETPESDFTRLRGFGTFTHKITAPRPGRNPRTGKPIKIAEKHRLVFTASMALKQRLNDGS